MRNSLIKTIYHYFVIKYHNVKSFRGGWMLTNLFFNEYKNRKTNLFNLLKIHLKGWSYNDWSVCGITDENRRMYLSTRDYCSLHPFNGNYSGWIDDKLILKYILHGTEAGQYMPDYYFQITDKGKLLPLMDLKKYYSNDCDGLLKLLNNKKALAFKPIKSSLGVGFYKVEYKENFYFMNGEKMNELTFLKKIGTLKNYIITEFLFPHPEIAKFCDKSVGCLRYIIGRNLNKEILDIYAFMRFGTIQSKYVENYNSGGVLVVIKDGKYKDGNILDFEKNINRKIAIHPDTELKLKGEIPFWNEIVIASHKIAESMPQLDYMEIDFCITNNDRIKIIEINSLTSLDAIQTDRSIFEIENAKFFFKERLK